MSRPCAVVGIGQTKYKRRRDDLSLDGLVREAALRALEDANLTFADIDAVVLGKAPDALLKLGLSLAGLGERDAACSTFAAVLKQYPDASNALRQRVKVEQASASC